MQLPTLHAIRAASELVYRYMYPTPQYSWPLLNRRIGVEAWVKHENHTAVGAFKIRGALVYLNALREARPKIPGVIAATRGNFGQGVATAAGIFGLKATIVIPHANSAEKNCAMRGQGAELIEHGNDFQEALEFARALAKDRGLAFIESFDQRLTLGTATYALEFFESTPQLDTVYVPIGLGSSICGMAAARNGLGLATEIVGVVSAASPAYALSFAAGKPVEAPAQVTLADGLACRVPNAEALEIITANVARVITVSDTEIIEAMRAYFVDTHNVAEGAGAAALAGALQERDRLFGKRIGVVLTGGNVDRSVYAAVLHAAANP